MNHFIQFSTSKLIPKLSIGLLIGFGLLMSCTSKQEQTYRVNFQELGDQYLVQAQDYSLTLDKDYIALEANEVQSGMKLNHAKNTPILDETTNSVVYKEAFDKANLVVYDKGKGNAGYDIKLLPRGNIEDVQIELENGEQAYLSDDGQLVIPLENGEIRHSKPYAYQEINDEKIEVDSRFALAEGILSFEVGAYDEAYDLVIDPEISFVEMMMDDIPVVGIPCYVNGLASSSTTEDEAFILVKYDPGMGASSLGGNADVYKLASDDQIGTTWGVAFNQTTGSFFTSATIKRHSELGPGGTGAIYRITGELDATNTVINNTVSELIDLNDDANINTGAAPINRGLGAANAPSADADAYNKVGRVGIGDIDLLPDNETLIAINVNTLNGNTPQLVFIDVSNETNASVIKTIDINPTTTSTTCTNGTLVPWGIGIDEATGDIYIGAVCNAESGTRADLFGYVYRYNDQGDTDNSNDTFDEVLDISLDYGRSNPAVGGTVFADWQTWRNDNTYSPRVLDAFFDVDPQPIVADIEFLDNGDMMVGFIDRFGFQTGSSQFKPDGTPAQGDLGSASGERGRPAGGLLRFSPDATNPGTWLTPADNALCSYSDVASAPENEASLGGLAYLSNEGLNEILAPTVDPSSGNSNGLVVLDLGRTPKPQYPINFGTGNTFQLDVQDLLTTPAGGTNPQTIEKGQGLGDLELGVFNPTCQITDATLTPTSSSTFDLTVTQGQMGTGYTISVPNGFSVNPTSGSYGVSGSFTISPALSSGQSITVTITDNDVSNCMTTAVFENVPVVECEIDIENLNITCADNGFNYTVAFDVTWDYTLAASEMIEVELNGAAVSGSPFTPSGTTGTQPFSLTMTEPGFANTLTAFFSTTTDCDTTILFDLVPDVACVPECTMGNLGGTVFNDFDNDGVEDMGEPGQGNILVYIYECDNDTPVDSVYTNENGDWTISGLSNYPYRVEFSTPITPWLEASAAGADNGTDAQFVDAASCEVDFGVINPDDFCQTEPTIAFSCFTPGSRPSNPEPSVGTIPFTATMASQISSDVSGSTYGSLYGMAYDKGKQALYTAAFLKRHVGIPPDGLGAIYTTDYSSGSPMTSLLTTVPNTGTVDRTGANALPSGSSTPSNDPDAFAKVGKVGLGDIDISADGNTLYTVNLNTTNLVVISDAMTTPTVTEVAIASAPSCNNGVFRSLGVKVYAGKVYVGGVCTGENGGTADDLSGSIHAYDPVDGTWVQVLEFDLTTPEYNHGDIVNNPNPALAQCTEWESWADTYSERNNVPNSGAGEPAGTAGVGYGPTGNFEIVGGGPTGDEFRCRAQAMISDIEFTRDGYMLISLMDRTGHQLAYRQNPPNGLSDSYDGNVISSNNGGDMLIAFKNNGNWELEDNASLPSGRTSLGANNSQGPGGGEFFYLNRRAAHEDADAGGIVHIPSTDVLIGAVLDPNTSTFTFGGGLIYYDVTDGTTTRSDFTIIDPTLNTTGVGKANGIGDLEAFCDPLPIQVGNYVWLDTNMNGVQDACEDPVSDLIVKLYDDAGLLIGQDTTDAEGEYYFDITNVDTTGIIVDGAGAATPTTAFVGLNDGEKYFIVFMGDSYDDLNDEITVGSVMYQLTDNDDGDGSNPDQNDSDITEMNVPNVGDMPVIMFVADSTDHTLDAGLIEMMVDCPDILAINDTTICNVNSFTLPPIQGDNLTSQAAYYTMPNGEGTKYNVGDIVPIPVPTTLYAYDALLNNPQNNLIGRYTFENTNNDVSGNGNDPTAGTAATYSTDAIEGSTSLDLDGSTDEVIFSDVSGSPFIAPYTERTFSMWIKPNNLVGSKILYDQGDANNGIALRLFDDIVQAGIATAQVRTSATAATTLPDDDCWHHVAVVFENSTLTVYLDGVAGTPVATSFATALTGAGGGVGLGRAIGNTAFTADNNNEYYGGLIDDFRLIDAAAPPSVACFDEESFVVTPQTIEVTPTVVCNGVNDFDVTVQVDWTAIDFATETIEVEVDGQMMTITPTTVDGTDMVSFSFDAPAFDLLVEANFSVTTGCSASTVVNLIPDETCAPVCTDGLGGSVFVDYSNDGVDDGTNEPGQPNILVYIYECDNDIPVDSTYTNENGDWNIDGLSNYPYRVEFSTPLTPWLSASTQGTDNGTDVQFVDMASCEVDFAVTDKTVCIGGSDGQDDTSSPQDIDVRVAAVCYVDGDITNDVSGEVADVLVAYDYDAVGSAAPAPLATKDEMGSLWGITAAPNDGIIYTSAFLKRHSGMGPEGSGAIYQHDLTTGTNSLFVDLVDLGINVGTMPANRDLGEPSVPSYDAEAYSLIGKMSLGDVDVDLENSVIYVVNLFDKTLYAIDIDSKTIAASYPIPDPGCNGGEWRPFAVKFYQGSVYVGGVCDASSSQMDTDLTATVYQLVGNTFAQVFAFPLDYTKGGSGNTQCNGVRGWFPWSDSTDDLIFCPGESVDRYVYPTPILSDIDFDVDGSMILGFVDRTSHQIGRGNYGTDLNSTDLFFLFAGGDILRAGPNGLGGYLLEDNASANGVTTAGAGNNQGPGGGEFYFGDAFFATSNNSFPHAETALGGLALLPGTGEVLASSYDPINGGMAEFGTGGSIRLSNITGNKVNGKKVFDLNDTGTLGKSAGIGDLELTCQTPAPIQVGNYVWLDTGLDGVQDACEDPVSDLIVKLYDDVGLLIGQDTTDADGEYYFDITNVDTTGITVDGAGEATPTTGFVGLNDGEKYFIVFMGDSYDDLNDEITVGSVMYQLTDNDDGDGSNPDQNDSDVTEMNIPNVGDMPVIMFVADSTDHTLDAGLIPAVECALDITAISTSSCVANTFDATVSLSWVGGPPAGDFEFNVNGGAYTSITRMNFESDSTETIVLTGLACETTKEFSIRFVNDQGCFSEAQFVFPPVDPAGYIYCVSTGQVIEGGTVRVNTPVGGTFIFIDNLTGDNGRYAWAITGSPAVAGQYTMEYIPPSGYTQTGTPGDRTGDTDDILDPTSGSEDNPSGVDPLELGSDVNGAGDMLNSFDLASNPFFLTFDLDAGDAFVDLNNIPLLCPNDICVDGVENTEIEGTVWTDEDYEGDLDENPAGGVPGMVVYVYDDCAGTVDSTVTNTQGDYSFTGLDENTTYRLEFRFPDSLDYLTPSIVGTDNGSTVQFTMPGMCRSLGVVNAAEFCEDDPLLFLPCYVQDDNITGDNNMEAVGVAIRKSGATAAGNNSPAMFLEVPANQMGSTYGVAFQKSSQQIFTSSYVKRKAGLGPDGNGGTTTGGIYQITNTEGGTSSASLLIDLNPIITTGADPHPLPTDACPSGLNSDVDNDNCWLHDVDTYDKVGKIGLGDLEISPDQDKLFTVNLNDRTLVEINIGNPVTTVSASDVVEYDLSTYFSDCSDDDWLPFALGKKDDKMYLGVTCTAETSRDLTNLDALIYEFDPSNPGVLTLLSTFDLDYSRVGQIRAAGSNATIPNPPTAEWQYWADEFDFDDPNNSPVNYYYRQSNSGTMRYELAHPQPMFSDIEFVGNDLIIALRDRTPDQAASSTGNPFNINSDTLFNAISAGDILCASFNGTTGSQQFDLESDGTCGAFTNIFTNTDEGPDGDEFFDDGNSDRISGHVHDEIGFGGLAITPGDDCIAMSQMNPSTTTSSGGIGIYNRMTGKQDFGGRVYNRDANPYSFSKAAGLGDLEALCSDAILQIGNYVWQDDDRDGVQDACEPGIPNIPVELYDETGTLIASTTTTPNGQYYFTKDGTPNETWVTSGDSLMPETKYFVVFGNGQYNTTDDNITVGGEDLIVTADSTGTTPTERQNDSNPDATERTDGTVGSIPSGLPFICYTTGINIDHSLDLGLAPEPPILGAIGNYVWLDENSDGLQDAGEPGIPNVRVILKDMDGNPIDSTVTDPQGGYLFPDLPAAMYFVDVDETTLPDTDGNAATQDLTQTTIFTNVVDGSDDDTDLDDGDFGNKDQSMGNGYKITLDPGEENLTADFGYNYNPTDDVNDPNGSPLGALGDRVWYDADQDGVQDPEEAGVEGVTVKLIAASDVTVDGTMFSAGDQIATDVTDANGNYLFDGLPAGAYNVMVIEMGSPIDGYEQTGDPDHFAVSEGDNPDDDVEDDGMTTKPVVLGPGDVFLNVDFGYDNDDDLGAIGDFVWLDADADGNGPNTVGADGVSVNQGNAGEDDADETPIEGVTVSLIKDTDGDGKWDDGEPIIATDVTDENGLYFFPGLPAGNGEDYLVIVTDTDNVLDGLKPTYDADGDAGTGNTVDVNPNDQMSNMELGLSAVTDLLAGAGNEVVDQDFGYTPEDQEVGEGLIGDYVWYDTNNDGVQDPDEAGIEGVKVDLYDLGADDAIGGTGADADTYLSSTVTDENGYYYFGGLPVDADGEGYQVRIAAAGSPSGMDNFAPEMALEDLVNTFDPNDMTTNPDDEGGVVTLTTADPVDLDQDFGYVADPNETVGSLGNKVFNDVNANGVRDAGEMGFNGVTIDLYRDLNGNGQLDSGEPKIGTTTTATAMGDDGMYLFENLPIDSFIVDVTDVDGVLNGYWKSDGDQDPTTNGGDDAMGNPMGDNSKTDAFSVGLTPTIPDNLNVDFGYYKDPAAVGNYVWVDEDGDGQQDVTEMGLEDVIVSMMITYPDGTMITLFDTTDANGFYEFPNLLLDEDYRTGAGNGTNGEDPSGIDPSGTLTPLYVIKVDEDQDALDGFAPTLEDETNGGITDADDSDAFSGVPAIPVQGSQDTDQFQTDGTLADATEEEVEASYDFGVAEQVALGNLVFMDTNDNGVFDDGTDMAVANVQLELFLAGDDPQTATPVGTAMTDMNGYYYFDELAPGDYFVYIKEENFQTGGPLVDKLSSAGSTDPDVDTTDDDDNGIDDPMPATNGISSEVVTLSAGDEPEDEAGAGGDASGTPQYPGDLPDGNVNETVDFSFFTPEKDFGDLPDNYSTLEASNGPSHIIVDGLKIGTLIDADNDGQVTMDATGDDTDAGGDDEDGVSETELLAITAATTTLSVNVMNMTGEEAKLYGFFDWNADGDFTDTYGGGAIEEAYVITVPDGTNGAVMLPIAAPDDGDTPDGGGMAVVAGTPTGFRFRLTTDMDLMTLFNNDGDASVGAAIDGEVEDYFASPELPVEFLYFEAKADVDHIDLTWATASELNNSHFELERSEDAKSFKSIATIEGQGTTLETSEYAFADEEVIGGVVYYYRVKQVDIDGTVDYSDIRSAKLNKGDTEWKIYPNPIGADQFLQVEFYSEATSVAFYVMDIDGKQVMRAEQDLTTTGWQQIQIDVSYLPASTYMLVDEQGNSKQFIKINE